MTGRLAAVGLGLMALVCVAVLVLALLAFTWLIDRASEMFEYKAAHPTSSSASNRPTGGLPGGPPGRRPGGFVTDVGEYSQLRPAPSRLDHY
jgi:hypothetical protein